MTFIEIGSMRLCRITSYFLKPIFHGQVTNQMIFYILDFVKANSGKSQKPVKSNGSNLQMQTESSMCTIPLPCQTQSHPLKWILFGTTDPNTACCSIP